MWSPQNEANISVYPRRWWRSPVSLVFGALAAGLFGFVLGQSTGGLDTVKRSQSHVATPGDAADDRANFDQALTLARQKLGVAGYAEAYDLLLVAARLRPTDPQLFDAALEFVENASGSKVESDRLLAEELYARGESLIAYQAPAAVSDARQRYESLAARLDPPRPAVRSSPFSEVETLLIAARQNSAPVRLRQLALEQARAELDNLLLAALAQAGADSGLPPEILSRRKELAEQVESIETSVVAELFAAAKRRADEWIAETTKTLSEYPKADAQGVLVIADRLNQQLDTAAELRRELTPYADAHVSSAQDSVKAVEDQVGVLQRTRTWSYNQDVLSRIREIERRTDESPLEALRTLAAVREDRLDPYILRRLNDVWEKQFDKLTTDDDRVAAVKLRVLKPKE